MKTIKVKSLDGEIITGEICYIKDGEERWILDDGDLFTEEELIEEGFESDRLRKSCFIKKRVHLSFFLYFYSHEI